MEILKQICLFPKGGRKAIDELFSLCPQGLDGLILCAGIPGSRKDLRLILSVNYFGTISIIKGAYDLLKRKTAPVSSLPPAPFPGKI